MIPVFCQRLVALADRVRNTRDANMTEEETDSADPPAAPAIQLPPAANDNRISSTTTTDPRFLAIARAIGRLIAREQIDQMQAANDNTARDD